MQEWQPITTAPRDGRAITVAVPGRCELGTGLYHELPYPVRYVGGRWVFVRNDAPLFPWQRPVRWREAEHAAA